MLWLKAFHLIFMVTWFAGLFYLPRLFVYHAMSSDSVSRERFKIMERKLYYGIMTPGMLLTLLFGVWMLGNLPCQRLAARQTRSAGFVDRLSRTLR
jgi:putative membrane protein